jgi:iron complex outermembrane recepter protein
MNKRILMFLFASIIGTVFGFGDMTAVCAQERGKNPPNSASSRFNAALNFHNINYKAQTVYILKPDILDRKLQVNVSAFYYDHRSLHNTVNVALPQSPVPVFAVVFTPHRMIGAEMSTEYLLTVEDRITLNAGWLDSKITSYPKQYLELSHLSGQPPVTANISYDHTFTFENGTVLVPRAEIRYTSGEYISNFKVDQPALAGLKPYGYQDGYVTGDIGATWIGPESKYSATAYVRNVTDKTYKAGAKIDKDLVNNTAAVGDPRTFGVMIKAKF